MKKNKIIFTIALFLIFVQTATAQVKPVFPNAEGHAKFTYGGSGRHLATPAGTVYKVTTLADSGAGSLRACVQASGPRHCVFEISGRIVLESRLRATEPYLSIWGETSPGGIMLTCDRFTIEDHNIMVRHIAVRVGEKSRCGAGTTSPDQRDNIVIESTSATGGTYDVMLDHVSTSWAIDENISTYKNPVHPATTKITISNSIIAEALHNSEHSSPTGHGMGLIIGDGVTDVSLIKNVFAHNNERNPRLKQGGSVEMINNIAYNYGPSNNGKVVNMTSSSGSGAPASFIDAIGNKAIKGIWSQDNWTVYGDTSSLNPASRVYVLNNLDDQRTSTGQAQSLATNLTGAFLSGSPTVASGNVTVLPISTIEDNVLGNAGAFPSLRKATDTRIINDVQTRTGDYKDCTLASAVAGCSLARQAGDWDTIPIIMSALNVPANPYADDNGNGYTNFEDWVFQYAAQVENDTTPKVFPDAEGHAKFATNYRLGSTLCIVDTLADTDGSATLLASGRYKGSLRECAKLGGSAPKSILIQVAGKISLTDSIMLQGSTYLVGANNVMITCSAINFDTSANYFQAFGRCIGIRRRARSENFVLRNLKIYQGANTATPSNSTNLNQGGGSIYIEDSENVYLRNLSLGSSNDETLTIAGAGGEGNTGYSENLTFHDILFTMPKTRKHFAAHSICIVAFNYGQDVPAVGDTMGLTYFRVGFTAGARGFENKCHEVVAANVIGANAGMPFAGMIVQGGVKFQLENAIFKGPQGETGLPITITEYNSHTDRGNNGLNGQASFYLSNITTPAETFTGSNSVMFKLGTSLLIPKPVRTMMPRINQIDSNAILPLSTMEEVMYGQNGIGNTYYLNCDGTKNYGARDRLSKLSIRYLKEGKSPRIKSEFDLGGFDAVTGNSMCAGVIDGDFDGLPTAWEDLHDCVDSTADDWNADPDGDGYKNYEEYANGTNPCVAD